MTYDESPVDVKYQHCQKAMEILRNNVKDPKTDPCLGFSTINLLY